MHPLLQKPGTVIFSTKHLLVNFEVFQHAVNQDISHQYDTNMFDFFHCGG